MSKYLVNVYGDEWEAFDCAEDTAQFIIDNMEDYYFDDILDDEGYIEICGMEYARSSVLKKVDPIAYNCAKNDWLDGEYSEIIYLIERLNIGEEENIYGWTVYCEETEEEV